MFGGRKRRRALQERGVQARGVIVEVRDTGMTVNDNPRVAMRLRVEPKGEEPFEISKKKVVSRLAIPQAGAQTIVVFDPEDHDNVEFDEEAMARANAEAQAAGRGSASKDPLDRLQKLSELRAAGALNEREFEAQKAKILSEA